MATKNSDMPPSGWRVDVLDDGYRGYRVYLEIADGDARQMVDVATFADRHVADDTVFSLRDALRKLCPNLEEIES
jgi:hypothetical protein